MIGLQTNKPCLQKAELKTKLAKIQVVQNLIFKPAVIMAPLATLQMEACKGLYYEKYAK